MYAKLIIYPSETGIGSDRSSTISTASHSRWELIADNLTPGKITELLLCLDELGFTDSVLTVAEPS